MRGIDYALVNLIPSLALIFLYINSKTLLTVSLNSKLFRRMILYIVLIMTSDSVVWIFDGSMASYARPILYIANFAFFILICLIPAQLLIYISERLWEFRIQKAHLWWFMLPIAVYTVFLALTPWYGTIFVIDEANTYNRGTLILFQQLLSISYVVTSGVISLVRSFIEESREKRREARAFSVFILMTIIGAVLQILDYTAPFMWQLTSASVVLVYILLQHEQITLDALTGLNNRRRMDQFIDSLIGRGEEAFHLIVIDVDDFKSINDKYGHTSGDEALKTVAKALMSFYSHTNAVISRYGGDEFCIISFEKDSDALAIEVNSLRAFISETVRKHSLGCELTVSVGSAVYKRGMAKSVLFESADAGMCKDKKRPLPQCVDTTAQCLNRAEN